MAFGIIVIACMVGGACNTEAPLMTGAATPAEGCSPARKTAVLDGIGAVVGGEFPNGMEFTRSDHNAIIPVADAVRARRVERLILRCVEWLQTSGAPRRGRTVGEDVYNRAQIDQLFAARMRR